MTTSSELHDVLTTEAELAESLAGVLTQQQDAIVHSRMDELVELTERSDGLLRPMEALEKERTRLAEVLARGGARNTRAGEVTSNQLLSLVEDKDAPSIASVIRRLRAASREVMRINSVNKPLLEHSQYFIRQTLRAATDDYKKNLVDKKM